MARPHGQAHDVADILKPHDIEGMELWPVSDAAKNSRNEGRELIERVDR